MQRKQDLGQEDDGMAYYSTLAKTRLARSRSIDSCRSSCIMMIIPSSANPVRKILYWYVYTYRMHGVVANYPQVVDCVQELCI